MKISIITPTFNAERTIAKNIESVLFQTYQNFEQIIVDNLSTDNTISIIKSHYQLINDTSKLLIISEKDAGIAEAFNKGILKASGEIIGILNADDFYFDKYVLEKVIKTFESKEVLFVHGNIYFKDLIYGSNNRKPLLCPIYKAMPYNHPSMFFRKEIYQKYGFYDNSFKYAMDFEFICRLERSLPNFRNRGKYLNGEPFVIMSAGGKSWENEIETLNEVRRALALYGFWHTKAKIFYFIRKIRIMLKQYFSKLGLNVIIKFWRNIKWRNGNVLKDN